MVRGRARARAFVKVLTCLGVNAFLSICVSMFISISSRMSCRCLLSLSLALTHSSSLPLPLSRDTEEILIIAKVDDASFSGASYKCLNPDSGQLADTMWKDGQGHDCKVSVVSN